MALRPAQCSRPSDCQRTRPGPVTRLAIAVVPRPGPNVAVSLLLDPLKAEVHRSFITTTENSTRTPTVGFELATNGIRFYVIAS